MMKFSTAFTINEEVENSLHRVKYEIDKAAFNLGRELIENICTKSVTHIYRHVSGGYIFKNEKVAEPELKYLHSEYRFELKAESIPR